MQRVHILLHLALQLVTGAFEGTEQLLELGLSLVVVFVECLEEIPRIFGCGVNQLQERLVALTNHS